MFGGRKTLGKEENFWNEEVLHRRRVSKTYTNTFSPPE